MSLNRKSSAVLVRFENGIARQEVVMENDEHNWVVVKGRGGSSANRIFLPAAGYGRRSDFRDAGFYGGYRSSTPYSDSYSAWYLDFASDSYCPISVSSRFDGFSVRAVRGFAPQ